MATGLRTVEDRGYTKRDEFSFAIDDKNSSKGYLQTLMLERDDCAMACDNEPNCKSFQMFTDEEGSRGKQRYCMLMNKDPKDVTLRSKPSEYTNVEVYSRPTVKPNAKGDTRLFYLKSAKPPDYKLFDGTVFLLDDGGLNYQPAQIGGVNNYYSDKPELRERNVIYPTGILTNANYDVGLGNVGGDGIIQMHTGVKACNFIPGVVTNTVPTNLEGTDVPQTGGCNGPGYTNCKAQNDVGIYCGYNKLDNSWIIQNWELLPSYLSNTLGIEYKAPIRPDGTSQTGIKKVDSVKIAKNDYCNTVPLSTFTDARPAAKCSEFVKSEIWNTMHTWYEYLLIRAAKEDWRSAPTVVREACTSTNATIGPRCVGAIRTLNVDDELTSNVIQSVNDINRTVNQSTEVITAIRDKVETYCQKYENSKECSCRNAVKYGVKDCKPDIPGCEDLLTYQKLLESTTKTDVLNEFVKNFPSRSLAGACKIADSVNEQTILQYGKASSTALNLNTCIQRLENEGQLTAENIVQKCEFRTKEEGGTDGAGGADGADGEDEESGSSTWIFILLGILSLFLLLGGAGIALFALS